MVVLSPLFVGERIRICTRCNCLGIESPIRERTSFRLQPKGFTSHCRRCEAQMGSERKRRHRDRHREKQRASDQAYRERMMADPEQAEAFRRRHREASLRYRQRDPERSRRQVKSYRARVAADPQRYQAALESRRMAYWLAAEREGRPLPDRGESDPREGKRYPIGPARRWLNELVEAERRRDPDGVAETRVAQHLGLIQRQLYAYRHEVQSITELSLDRICTNEGAVRLEEIYCDTGVFHGPEARA